MRITSFVLVLLMVQTKLFALSGVDSVLFELSKEIEMKEQYMDEKWRKINLLNSMLTENESVDDITYNYSVSSRLYEEYKTFIYDSAMHYATQMSNMAYHINNKKLIDKSRINIAFTLLSAGLFRESLDSLEGIQPQELDVENRKHYYFTLARAWFDLADYTQDKHYFSDYSEKGNAALQKIIALSDKESAEYLSWKGWYYLRNERTEEALDAYERLVANYQLSKHDLAIATSSLSYLYKISGNVEKSIEQIVIAAILDIQSATKEAVALLNLAEVLYNKDQDEFSLVCINEALENANFYGARHRKIKIAEILPIIQGNQLELKERQRKLFLGYSIGLSLIVIVLGFLIYTFLFQKRNMQKARVILDKTISDLRNTNNQLKEVNKIKEEYIGHFFSVISSYIDKLERLKKTINRKLTTKHYSDIDDIIQKINLASEREELYKIFDTTFQKLFPEFVGRFNSFFADEDKVNIEDGRPFSPELRIYALKRLGIDDNERIAGFLDYSLTTVYTYKAKLKKKAIIASEEFEEKLMGIEIR